MTSANGKENMADINDLFERFPDYDVFTGKTSNNTPKPAPPVERPKSDYGDGYGKAVKPVKIKNNTNNNFLTVLFFPFLILWLELMLRLSAGEGFSAVSFLYVLGFTIPIAMVLTLICTMFPSAVNRVLCNFFAFIITLFYLLQLCYFRSFGSFLTVSSAKAISPEQIVSATVDKGFYALAIALPFLFNLLFGHKIFGFRRFKLSAKLVLIIIAVIIQIGVLWALRGSAGLDPSSSKIYESATVLSSQERFGLLTMERLDLFKH